MSKTFFEWKTFEKIDFRNTPLEKWNYEHCRFLKCNFSGIDIWTIQFSECTFSNCDLSLIKTTQTVFTNIEFVDCKLLWVNFDHCSNFIYGLEFENCMLNLSSFQGIKLKNTIWKSCSIQEVNFTGSDISGSIFSNCDLGKSIFMTTNLESCDFSSAYNFSIHPEKNKIKKAKFSLSWTIGLLDSYGINIV